MECNSRQSNAQILPEYHISIIFLYLVHSEYYSLNSTTHQTNTSRNFSIEGWIPFRFCSKFICYKQLLILDQIIHRNRNEKIPLSFSAAGLEMFFI